MSKEKRRVPKLRFPGFTEDWEQRKFGEIMTFLNGRAYKQDELLGDGKYKVLRVGNFYTNDSWYYSNLELDDKFYATNGDLLYTWSATFGPHIWKGEKVIYHYHIWKLVLQDKIDKLFALQLLEVDKANIMSDKNGSTMVHITKQGMENKQTILPISLNEQKQIAKFLSSMDKLITLHQRKLEHLNLKKKALLQKLFPKNGERYPELRFPGFTDAWEQRKFGEIYERSSQKNDSTYGIDKIISVANMYFKIDATVGSEEYLKTYNVFKLGDIAFEGHTNKEYSYGRFVENTIGDGIVSHIFDVFTPRINLDINFWKDLIKYEPIMGPILRRCTKASRMMSNLTSKEFLEEKILCPTLEEQKLIGEFIVRIDKNITLHQRKLEHLQLQKKALLQQMFV